MFIFALCVWNTENCVQKNMKQKKVSAYCKRRQSVAAEAAAANRRYVAKAQSQWWQSTIERDSVERRRI